MNDILTIAGTKIKRGETKTLEINVARLYDYTKMSIPIKVVRGKKDGPTLFISGAIHGDEINGVEIIRRVLKSKQLKSIRGTLIAIPIVNVFGFNNKSRYLPDRRDLNRCFPGSKTGSLASQIAHIFNEEIVKKSTHGIDLHTASQNRANLPQVRGCLDDPETRRLAKSFKVPVMINSDVRDGSLRQAAREQKIPFILFEGGEALRFNEQVIKYGIHGIFSVMQKIGMLPSPRGKEKEFPTFMARSSHWVRAPHSGILNTLKQLGDKVKEGELLGKISDPFGVDNFEIRATKSGIIVGMSIFPLLNGGDAAFHIATFEDYHTVSEKVEMLSDGLSYVGVDRFLE